MWRERSDPPRGGLLLVYTSPLATVHPSHSISVSRTATAPSSSRVITHAPMAWGFSTIVPLRLLSTKFVNPGVPPCVVQWAGMARRL
jgi:hypothetical protein